MKSIRPMRDGELTAVYARVARDFPPIEYPPLNKMRGHVANGAVEVRLYEGEADENAAWAAGMAGGADTARRADSAYAFVMRAPATDAALLLLYAVEPGARGQGTGSAFLRALMKEYEACAGLYAEVEKAEFAPDEEGRRQCRRRIAFYERLGFVRVPGLHYVIYGVDMHLYYRPLRDPSLPNAARAAQELTALYHNILRRRERHNLVTHPV